MQKFGHISSDAWQVYALFIGELNHIKKVFGDQKKEPPIQYFHPPHSGRAYWASNYRNRIEANHRLLELCYGLPDSKEKEVLFCPAAVPFFFVLWYYRHAEILLQSHSYPPLCSGVVQEAMGTYKGLHTALEHYILNTYNEWKDGVCSACVICARHFKHPARPVWVKSQNENDTFRSYLHSLVSPQECRTTSPRCWRSTS